MTTAITDGGDAEHAPGGGFYEQAVYWSAAVRSSRVRRRATRVGRARQQQMDRLMAAVREAER